MGRGSKYPGEVRILSGRLDSPLPPDGPLLQVRAYLFRKSLGPVEDTAPDHDLEVRACPDLMKRVNHGTDLGQVIGPRSEHQQHVRPVLMNHLQDLVIRDAPAREAHVKARLL